MYKATVDEYRNATADEREATHDATCEGWQGWTAAMVDAGMINRRTVRNWLCPNCSRKGCTGEVVPLPLFDAPARPRRSLAA